MYTWLLIIYDNFNIVSRKHKENKRTKGDLIKLFIIVAFSEFKEKNE